MGEASLLQGYGVTNGTCKECLGIRQIGDMNICLGCAAKKVSKTCVVCYKCKVSAKEDDWGNWSMRATDLGVQLNEECESCGKIKVLNDDNLCYECFNRLKNG